MDRRFRGQGLAVTLTLFWVDADKRTFDKANPAGIEEYNDYTIGYRIEATPEK